MERFEELQSLWQNQRQDTARLESRIAAAVRDFHAYGSREIRITIAKTVLVVLALGLLVSQSAHRWRSPWFAAGQAITLLAVGIFLSIYWKNQLAIVRRNFGEPSLEFLRSLIAELERQERFVRRGIWLLLAAALAGSNLSLVAVTETLPLRARIAAHVTATLIPLAAFPFVPRLRRWRLAARHRELTERLAALERELRA